MCRFRLAMRFSTLLVSVWFLDAATAVALSVGSGVSVRGVGFAMKIEAARQHVAWNPYATPRTPDEKSAAPACLFAYPSLIERLIQHS